MQNPPKSASQFIEPNTHAFIVKIWLEEMPSGQRTPIWRGYITHVASGQRRYVRSLGQISACLELYLREMGVSLPPVWRLCRWLFG